MTRFKRLEANFVGMVLLLSAACDRPKAASPGGESEQSERKLSEHLTYDMKSKKVGHWVGRLKMRASESSKIVQGKRFGYSWYQHADGSHVRHARTVLPTTGRNVALGKRFNR